MAKQKKGGIGVLNRIVENDYIHRVSPDEYREKVKEVYDGPQGALLATASHISMHIQFGRRLIRTRKFDVRGMQSILDVGSGAGQIAQHLLEFADPDAKITCTDLSQQMLRRARNRLKSSRPAFVVADVTALPFADGSFDGITCGYVLEHVPDAPQGLSEMARVLRPGGRMLLLTTEDNFSGAVDKPLLVLPHVQSGRAQADLRVAAVALEEGALVHADSSGNPRGRNLR